MTNIDLPQSAYIHIPFCRRRCYYCDFPISVLGNKTNINTSSAIAEYVEVLCQEIAVTPVSGKPLQTIFFGGGTPSLLPVKQLERILATIARRFGIDRGAEISLEIDPGTFSLEQLQGYRQAGVNRVSLGVQAFQDELLKVCGRFHGVADIFSAIALIHQVGIDNFSIDLISGLPHQTLEQWQFSLESAIELAPAHLSCYDLVLEPVTAFGKQYRSGKLSLPTDEMAAEMYRLASKILTGAGYHHYEISNYAKNNYQCRHNRVYWQNKPYYGFGMGAASYTNRQRFTRPRTRQEYSQWVKQLIEAGGEIDCPQNSEIDILLETLMLGLRLAEGVNLVRLARKFGQDIVEKIDRILEPYARKNWVEFLPGDRAGNSPNISSIRQMRLTDPEGFLFSNIILAELFEQLGD